MRLGRIRTPDYTRFFPAASESQGIEMIPTPPFHPDRPKTASRKRTNAKASCHTVVINIPLNVSTLRLVSKRPGRTDEILRKLIDEADEKDDQSQNCDSDIPPETSQDAVVGDDNAYETEEEKEREEEEEEWFEDKWSKIEFSMLKRFNRRLDSKYSRQDTRKAERSAGFKPEYNVKKGQVRDRRKPRNGSKILPPEVEARRDDRRARHLIELEFYRDRKLREKEVAAKTDTHLARTSRWLRPYSTYTPPMVTRPPPAPIYAQPYVLQGNVNLRAKPQTLEELMLQLQHRDATPEDYELLLQLDHEVKKKTISEDIIDRFVEMPAKDVADDDDECAICLETYAVADIVKKLPCGHFFHKICIKEWLGTASVNCPSDGLPVEV